MDYTLYDKVIIQNLAVYAAVGILVIVVAAAAIVHTIKHEKQDADKEDRFVSWALSFLGAAAIVGTVVLWTRVFPNSVYELKHKAYIVSEGTFSVINDKQTPAKGCTFILNDGTRLDTTRYVLGEGEHSGRIVYGEKTGAVYDMELLY